MTRPDLEAIKARLLHPALTAEEFDSIMQLLAYIDDLEERCRAYESMRSEITRALDTWKQEEVPDETRP